MASSVNVNLPSPVIPLYFPVPPEIVYVPGWLACARHVFGLNDSVPPLPFLKLTLNEPLLNTNFAAVLPLGSTAAAPVKTADAITWPVPDVVDGRTSGKCSLPGAAARGL